MFFGIVAHARHLVRRYMLSVLYFITVSVEYCGAVQFRMTWNYYDDQFICGVILLGDCYLCCLS